MKSTLKITFFGLAFLSVPIILYQLYSQTGSAVAGTLTETDSNQGSVGVPLENNVPRSQSTIPTSVGGGETLRIASETKPTSGVTLKVASETKPTLSEGTATPPKSEPTLPNIVYLLADDLGYGDVAYNGGVAQTPNLDEMASSLHSIQFNRFYSGGPVCSPTRGTLLTGRNHNRYCIWHADIGVPRNDLTCPSLMPLPPSELTVAEILSEVGYHTAIYGKWHVGDLRKVPGGNKKWPVSNPTMHGFREWLVTERHTSNILPNCRCSHNDYSCKLNGRKYNVVFCRDYWYENPLTGQLEKSRRQVFEDSHYIVDRFEEFLKNRNKSRPFYSQLSFHSVHSQYLATPYWYNIYLKKYNADRSHYLGATSALDEAVGRVRILLKKYGIAENTLLWFSSDNGPQKNEPGSAGKLRGRKGDVLEGGIRVPGIIEWPAIIHGNRKTSVPVVTTDFLPTVAEIVGYKLPRNLLLDGISILPILNDVAGDRPRGNNIKYAFYLKRGKLDVNFRAAVVGDRYKFYAQFDKGRMLEHYLYDLDNDIGESKNVSEHNVELTLAMKVELEEFLKSVTKSATEIGCLETHDRRDVKC